MALSVQNKIKLLGLEVLHHRNFVVIFFAIFSSAVVLVGAYWPKNYSSSTTIFVEEENVIGPLMEGAAVQAEVTDRAAIAREIIYGKKIMTQLLVQEGGLDDNPDPVVQDRLIEEIKDAVTINNVRRNLIKIEFKDKDPERAYRITKNLSKIFINASHAAKAEQSTEAYEFIDKQAAEYKAKLLEAEHVLKQFRSQNIEANPGMVGEAGRINSELQSRREQIIQELREANIRKASLERQLSGEAQAVSTFSRTEQYKSRIAEYQAQLEDLRLSFHETYPDIVHLKAKIEDLRSEISQAEQSLQTTNQNKVIDDRVLANPVYQQLQRDLYDANTLIETLSARLDQVEKSIQRQYQRAQKTEDYEAKLQELTRDYEINHDSYTDLMRRREQARVSMNLNLEQKGLMLRVDEPAYMPHSSSGFQFMHAVLIGPIFGLLIPIGFIFIMLQFDPGIRDKSAIYDTMGIPVIGEIPKFYSASETRSLTKSMVRNIFVLLAAIIFIAIVGIMKA